MKKILALIDFSDVTPRILAQVRTFAQAMGSSVSLLHVLPPWPVGVDFAPSPASLDEFPARQRQLFAMRDSLATQGVNVTAQQFEGSVLELLLAQIEQFRPDIIIMGSHGHGALYNLIVGSVTAGILKHAGCPVLLIPSGSGIEEPETIAPTIEAPVAVLA
jgi:nucleotide-binding universal stress UspA family protein